MAKKRNKSKSKFTRKPGFKAKPKGKPSPTNKNNKSPNINTTTNVGSASPSVGQTVAPSSSPDPNLRPWLPRLSGASPAESDAESTTGAGSQQNIKRELGLLERIRAARKEAGAEPSSLETLVVGTIDTPGIRDTLEDFAKQNPQMFDDENTAEGAAAVELYNAAVELSEQALETSDPAVAKQLYERLKFILSVVKEREGSQSELAKKLEETIKPIAEQLQKKSTFQAFAKDRAKTYIASIPERIASDIPIVGGALSDFFRSKRQAKEDVEDYGGKLQKRISRGDVPMGRLRIGKRYKGEDGALSGRTAVQNTMQQMGGTPAAEVFPNVASQVPSASPSPVAGVPSGINEQDPEKNPLGAIYDEVVKIRELMEGKKPGKKDEEAKKKSVADRFKDIWNKITGKKEEGEGNRGGSSGEEDGGSVVGDAVEDAVTDSLMTKAGTAVGGAFTGLATPTMSVGAAGLGTVGAYALGGAALGTAAAYGINKGIDAAMGFKEGEGLADYQMQASTYNPLEFLDVTNYMTGADTDTSVDEQTAKGMKPVILENIKSGIASAQEISRSVHDGILTKDEAESAIKEAQNAEKPKYDENFLEFYKEVQKSFSEAKDDGDMMAHNQRFPGLMKKYGYDNENKNERLTYRNSDAAQAQPASGEAQVDAATPEMSYIDSQIEMAKGGIQTNEDILKGIPEGSPEREEFEHDLEKQKEELAYWTAEKEKQASSVEASATPTPGGESSIPTAEATPSETTYSGPPRDFKMNLEDSTPGTMTLDGVPFSEMTPEELEMVKGAYEKKLEGHITNEPKDTNSRRHEVWEDKKELYEKAISEADKNLQAKSGGKTAQLIGGQGDTTLGKMINEAESQRKSLENARADASAPSPSSSPSNINTTANTTVVTNNFNDSASIRNNEPTQRYMQMSPAYASRA